MASILQVKGKWRAQVRRKGHPPYTQTFPVKAQAEAWARQVEAAIDAGRPPPQALVMGGLTVGEAVREYRRLRATSRPVADDSNDHYTLRRIERLLGARAAHTNQQRAAAILAAPPKVPGDDAASAQAQIDAWIAGKGAQ